MLFFPKSIIGANNSEKKLWEALKIALEQEPGVTYFGFRPRNRNGHIIKESDILILHQEFGICVIECKGCRIDRIKSINGEEWHMEEGNGWYRKTMQPLTQAKDAMFAVVNELDYFIKYELNRSKPLKINNAHLVALPFITRQQWQDRGFDNLPTKADWQNIGYEVHGDSDFSSSSVKAGKTITITRLDKTSPHEVDRENFDLKNVAGSLLIAQTFDSVFVERQWIVEEIVKDINIRGFEPEDILITGVCGDNDKKFYNYIRETLQKKGVETFYAGEEKSKNVFRQNGCVTISSIYRAKGNEAWKVYVCRFEYSDRPLDWKKPQESELHKRNEAFTALTRAKAWCVVTGLHSPVFNELNKAIAQYPNFTFPAFNKKSLKRITDDENSNSSSLQYRDELQPPKIYTLSDLDRKSKKIKPLLKPIRHKA